MPILATSQTLNLSPSSLPAQLPTPRAPAAAKASSFPSSFRQRATSSLSISFAGSFPWSSLTMPSRCCLSRVSCSTALSSSGGGGGDGLDGGAGGGGGDGGSSGKEAEARLLVGETEEASGLESDVIVLSVGGMTCGGCVASVKRILESRPQVASATVYLEKEIAVILPVPEAKDTENWQQQLGEKLANHLTASGFKSTFQGVAEISITYCHSLTADYIDRTPCPIFLPVTRIIIKWESSLPPLFRWKVFKPVIVVRVCGDWSSRVHGLTSQATNTSDN